MNAARSSTATGTIATAKAARPAPAAPLRGRFAPSPTGPLHAGSLLAAVGSYLDARAIGGEWLVRIEDVDRQREVPGAADEILRTLERFGLQWDGAVVRQSERGAWYAEALAQLARADLSYPCSCARADLEAATGGRETRYPGHCRAAPRRPGAALAVRLRTHAAPPVTIVDRLQAALTQSVEDSVGDFVLRRRDGFYAYQLAVVVDDAAQGITDVVRGLDLYDNSPRQWLLQRALGLPAVRYLHLPLVVDANGEKLSKSRRALPVGAAEIPATLGVVLAWLGHPPPASLSGAPAAEQLEWAALNWNINNLQVVTKLISSS